LAYPASRDSVFHALHLAEQYDVKILLDVNWRPVFCLILTPLVKLFSNYLSKSIFSNSEEEAEWLFETTDPGAITYRLDSVGSTAGEHGCAYCLSENEGRLPAFSVPVIETTTGRG